MRSIFSTKPVRLFLVLAGIFITNVLVAEFIGIKIFSLERTLGLDPVNFTIFGKENMAFNMTAGVLLWPVVFVMTDIINEYYGVKGVRFLSFLSIGLIAYAFLMIFLAIWLIPADFWPASLSDKGIPDMNAAFKAIFGQGLNIIFASILAFIIGQFLDAYVFQWLKKKTGEKKVWLRATGSTLLSQFVDSFVVLLVAFYFIAGWELSLVLAIGVVNYIYKFLVAILLTPVIYGAHKAIDSYLGQNQAQKMKAAALFN